MQKQQSFRDKKEYGLSKVERNRYGKSERISQDRGRQAGTPNKITSELRDFLSNLIDDNRDQIVKDVRSLRPKERLAVLERLMQFVLPRQQAVRADIFPNRLPSEVSIDFIGDPNNTFECVSREEDVDLERLPLDYKWPKPTVTGTKTFKVGY